MTWPMVVWTIKIKRYSFPYDLAIIIPYVSVTYLSFFGSVIHPGAGERLGLGITCILTLIAINFILADLLPMVNTVTDMASISLYSLAWCMCSLIQSIVVINLDHTKGKHRLGIVRACCNFPVHPRQRDIMETVNYQKDAEALIRNAEQTILKTRSASTAGGETVSDRAQQDQSLLTEKTTAQRDAEQLRVFLEVAFEDDDESCIEAFVKQKLTISQLPHVTIEDMVSFGIELGTARRLSDFLAQELDHLSIFVDYSYIATRVDMAYFIFAILGYTLNWLSLGLAFTRPYSGTEMSNITSYRDQVNISYL